MNFGIKGVVPGDPTEREIRSKLLKCKFWGGLCIGTLAVAAQLYDSACMQMLGTHLGTTSLLIIAGAVLQTARQVRQRAQSHPDNGFVLHHCRQFGAKSRRQGGEKTEDREIRCWVHSLVHSFTGVQSLIETGVWGPNCQTFTAEAVGITLRVLGMKGGGGEGICH